MTPEQETRADEETTGAPTRAAEAYRRQLEQRVAEKERRSRHELGVSVARLVVMLAVFVVAWVAVQNGAFSLWWTLVPVAVFLGLVSAHERLLRRKRRAEMACEFYRRGLARLQGRWRESKTENGARFAVAGHLYADDLDLLGPGSLYLLLNETRTAAGEATLANWLLGPAEVAEAGARQAAVADLRSRLTLREEMASLGAEVRSDLDPERLESWARSDAGLSGRKTLRTILALAAGANVGCLALWILGVTDGRPLLVSCIASFALFLGIRRRVLAAIEGVERTSRDLEVVAEILDRLQQEEFDAPWLAARAEELRSSGGRPGRQLRRLQRWVQRVESRRNAFFAPFAALVLWNTQIAFVIEDWRLRWGSLVLRWLEIVGELEAVACFAGFAFERGVAPHDEDADLCFPEFVEGPDPVLAGRGLGHPLIEPEHCVRNDVALGAGDDGPVVQTLVISGSNMSGKSTFLRSCGLNVVLAFAGAPVLAQALRVSPMNVGASIRIQDSLQEGSSKFYAEIRRLRGILDLARGDLPALCLLDEILHGTNSHDRRIGAAAVVRALMAEDALVLVTTHDLALARLTEAADFTDAESGFGRLENVHFVDTIEDGRIHFDYRLRPGIVDKSNALELMREVGLDV